MTTPEKDLKHAIAGLGRSKRRALVASLAGRRDVHAAQRDRPMAEFYNALASLVADVADDEVRVLRALQTDLDNPPAA
ncbi:hypothetical protein ACWG5N_29365 [Streptomyces globisporus]